MAFALHNNPLNKKPLSEITIDKTGRVVIPQNVREHLNLQNGTKLGVFMESDNIIVLKVIPENPPTERKQGVLVITGKLSKTGTGKDDLVKLNRDERIQKLLDL